MKKLIPVLLMTGAAMIAAGCGVAPSATTRAADESTTMSTTTADQSTATITTSSASSPCVNAAQNGFNEDDTIRNCPTIVDAVAAGKIASQQGIATTSVDSSSLQLDCETPDLRLPSAGNVSIPTDLAATPVCRQFNTECLDLVELRAFVSWAAANPNSYPPYNATAITDQKRAACDTKYFSSP